MEAPVKPDKIDLLTESPILLAIKCLICKKRVHLQKFM